MFSSPSSELEKIPTSFPSFIKLELCWTTLEKSISKKVNIAEGVRLVSSCINDFTDFFAWSLSIVS